MGTTSVSEVVGEVLLAVGEFGEGARPMDGVALPMTTWPATFELMTSTIPILR